MTQPLLYGFGLQQLLHGFWIAETSNEASFLVNQSVCTHLLQEEEIAT